MHLHQLHAATALHDLTAAITALGAQATAALLEPAACLRSTTYGTRHASGAHSDPVATGLTTADDGHTRWAALVDSAHADLSQACWLVRSAAPDLPRAEPVLYLRRGIPLLDARTARDVAGWLTAAAARAWRALGTPPPREPLPGIACPRCETRMLQLATAAPDRADWTVVCAAGCRYIALWTAAVDQLALAA